MRIVTRIKSKKRNFFLRKSEAFTMYKEAAHYPALQLMLGFCLFRGMRIGEVRAINIRDFKNPEFTQIDIILQKSNILDEFPIIKDHAELVKYYVMKNAHRMKDGYFFPHYNKLNMKEPYLDRQTVNTMFFKFRKMLKGMRNSDDSLKYPWANDKGDYYDPDTGKVYYNRHRIGWHSCRRFFETMLWEKGYTIEEIAHIMRYSKRETVFTYINCYEIWKKEADTLEDTFGDIFKECVNFSEGQRKLKDFCYITD